MVHFYKSHKKYFFILVGICLFIYLRSIGNGYNLDDELVTIQHPLTAPENGLDLQAIFTSPYSIEKFGYTYGYRPMVHLSFALEHLLFGESAAMSHLVNLLLYTLTVLFLVYFLTEWLGRQHFFLVSLSCLLFAIHPLHVEVVASIKNRDELLAFLAALLAMHAYLRQVDGIKIKYLLASFIFTIIALLSKKTAIPVLVLIPFLDILYHQRFQKTSLLLLLPTLLYALWVGLDFSASFYPYSAYLLICVLLVYFVWHHFSKWQESEVFKQPFFQLTVYLLLCVGVIYFAINTNIMVSLLLVFAALRAIRQAHYYLLWPIIATYLFFSIYFKQVFFSEVILISVLFAAPHYFKGPKLSKWASVISGLLALSAILIVLQNVLYVTAFLMYGVIAYFFYRSKVQIALILSIFQCVFTLCTRDFNFATVFFTSLLALQWLQDISKQKWFFRFYFVVLSLLIVSLGILALPKPSFQDATQIDTKVLIANSNQVSERNGIKEGRPLEFVENPLVYKHTFQQKAATSLQVVSTYLKLHFFPYPLRYYYGYKTVEVHQMSEWTSLLSLLLLLLLMLIAFYCYHSQRIVTLSLLLFVVPLLLASNWFVLIAGMIAERHTYASTLGFSLLLAWAIYKLKANSWEELRLQSRSGFLFYTVTICFITLSFVRVGAWQTPIVLMETDQQACQQSAHAHSLLATSYIKVATEDVNLTFEEKQVRIDQAISAMRRAIRIFPYLYNYHFDLGRFYVLKNDYAAAFTAFENAYKLVPENPLAIDELVKCSFDLNRTKETIFYGEKLLLIVGPQEKTVELMAFQALTTQDFSAAQKWSKYGIKHFAGNPNFNRLLQDAQNYRIVNKSK
ncbi:MAG: tetratricopeptide repeat protein [Flavobacteriales bacterium]